MSVGRPGIWVQLSMAIARMPCMCTEDDNCDAHELLDQLYAQTNGQIPQTA